MFIIVYMIAFEKGLQRQERRRSAASGSLSNTFKLRAFSVSTVTVTVRHPANAVKFAAGFDNVVNALNRVT